MSNLPSSWRLASLDELCDLNPRSSVPDNPQTPVSFIPMPAVSEIEGKILDHATKAFSEVAKGYTRFRSEDVLFAKITPCMENGKIAIARGLRNDFGCGSTEFHVLRSRAALLPDYLWRFLRQNSYRADAERHMTGAVGQRRVPVEFLRKTLIPLPPLEEQHRIIMKLETLFSRSRTAREELARIPQLIERYKQTVLTAAFRGDLTENWRVLHPDLQSIRLSAERAQVKRKREGGSIGLRTTQQTQLPQKWKSVTVDYVGEVMLGRQRSPENHTGPNMRPYMRAANITWGGWDLSDVKEMNFDERDFNKFKLHRGDVLINEGSGSADEVGKPAICNGEIESCCFQNTLIAVRPHAVTSEYLYFVFLNAARSRAFVDETRGVNIHHIGRAGLAQFVIPLPPVEEQQEIVRRVQSAFRYTDKILAETSRAVTLLDRLDQATLTKAFRGKLVPQLASDVINDVGSSRKARGDLAPKRSPEAV